MRRVRGESKEGRTEGNASLFNFIQTSSSPTCADRYLTLSHPSSSYFRVEVFRIFRNGGSAQYHLSMRLFLVAI